MDRRDFLINASLTTSGLVLSNHIPTSAFDLSMNQDLGRNDLYNIFKKPDVKYRPYVRWWWNGDKVKKEELARELRVLKSAGIGGVEINPIKFPAEKGADDMGFESLKWLSDEWIEMLHFTFSEAKSLNMTCDLLVGTGFPMGAEFLKEGDRSQIVVIAVKKLEGPLNTEFSLFDLYKEADPQITNLYSGRTMELLSVKLVPDPLNNMDEIEDLSDQIKNENIKFSVANGKFALYALVKVEGVEHVIVGAPGGRGPVLDHFDKGAVERYLQKISNKIKDRIGPFPSNFRAFFVDSMELEGANWTIGMRDEFKRRRGYDIFPYLPFILFKVGRMGNTIDPDYTVKTSEALDKKFQRMRYDWALTNAEVFRDSFVETYAKWCTDNKVKSRIQAYGRGYFPVTGSFPIDIPECETWLKYGIGKDIPEDEFTKFFYDKGRGYTMINKYVSSGAHLKGKRLISSEELTNTSMVFNENLEIFKIAGDLSTISGVTQPIFHGYDYSPEDAPFPGWIRWGGYYNERNTMWPYFNRYTDYRSRLSALFQQGDMYADIALLAPIPDMWGKFGAQNEPFPIVMWPEYQQLIWESLHQNGNGCDYVSEQVINDAQIRNGFMKFGPRKYNTIILIDVKGISPDTIKQLYNFVSEGGKVICIEACPDHYPGWENHTQRDKEVRSWIKKLKQFEDRFILVEEPEEGFCRWMSDVQEKYAIKPYVKIARPQTFITQMRYSMPDTEVLFFINSSDSHGYQLKATFSDEITRGNQTWLWDAVTGERFKLRLDNNQLKIAMGPAESKIIVFNKDDVGEYWRPTPLEGDNHALKIDKNWKVQLQRYDGHIEFTQMDKLIDLKNDPDYAHFAGTIRYKNTFTIDGQQDFKFLNLGKVYGISIVNINGKDAGVQWFGHRIYSIGNLLQKGENTIEVWVVTVMVNYMKTLKDNKTAQIYTEDQPLQSLGLAGPVYVY